MRNPCEPKTPITGLWKACILIRLYSTSILKQRLTLLYLNEPSEDLGGDTDAIISDLQLLKSCLPEHSYSNTVLPLLRNTIWYCCPIL